MEQVQPEFVAELFTEGKTIGEVQARLQHLFPGQRGFSIISVKRFCKTHGLSPRIKMDSVREMVAKSVEEVGPTFGRKMMTGYIAQKFNVSIGQNRIAAALAEVSPNYNQRRRRNTARLINPIPYKADYFGHKLHVDQNEKLVRYGVTHVVAIDGHSRYIVAGTTMPIKNNLTIYENIYRKACFENGMFHQVRVDCGKEFYLMLGVQEIFADLRGDQTVQSYRQTQSKQNLPIERVWVEVNSRVNYPLKQVLVEMENALQIDMENEAFKFCVSEVTCRVASYGLELFISSWNRHPIAGRGVPSRIKARTNRLQPLNPDEIPDALHAKELYERVYSGRLTEFSNFGMDPLAGSEELINQRENQFREVFQIPIIFNGVVNGNKAVFKDAILLFIGITSRLSP